MKKFISIIIAALILVQLFPSVHASSEAWVDGEYFAQAHELLTGLGFSDITSRRTKEIGREDWLDLAISHSYYEDIEKINLPGAGIYSNTNYYFLPEGSLELNDALVMLVKLLGYQPGVDYPDSYYISMATRLGLDDGINGYSNNVVTYEMAYVLIFNYLKADVAEIRINSGGNYIESGDTNILHDKYDIVEVSGQITETESYSLDSSSNCDSGFLKLGDELCRSERYDSDSFFGKNVTAYICDYKGRNEIVSLSVNEDSKVYDILSDDIDGFKSGILTFYENETNEKRVKISLYADIFKNGERFDYDEKTLVPKSGKITVIDNNRYSDGADVVVIEDATDIKLDGINREENKIYSADTVDGGYVIDEDETKLLASDGAKLDFETLTNGNILSLWLKSNGTVWKAVLCLDGVEGNISETDSEGIVINGVKYGFSATRYDKFKDKIAPGITVKVTFNTSGDIADIEETIGADGIVGMLLECKYKKTGLNKSMHMKFFENGNEPSIYPVSENVRINGKRAKDYDEAFSLIPKVEGTDDKVVQKLVIYKLSNAGEIVSLEYPSNQMMDTDGESKLYVTGYTSNSNAYTGRYNKYSKYFGIYLMVEPSTTTMFRLPRQEKDGRIYDDPEYWEKAGLAGYTPSVYFTDCTITGYTTDPNSKVAKYVTVEYDGGAGASQSVGGDDRAAMIGSIKQCIWKDEPVEAITLYSLRHQGTTVYGKTATYFTDLGISAGDIVRVSYNSETKIVNAIETIWTKDSSTLANGNYQMGKEGDICDIKFFNVFKMWNNVADMYMRNVDLSTVTTDDARVYRADLFAIYRYDYDRKEIEKMSYKDFIGYDITKDQNECTKVITDLRYYDPMSMFVVECK